MKFIEEFAKILEEHQKATGETYREIAERAQISHSTIATIKAGKTDRPMPVTLAKLDAALSLPEGHLFKLWVEEHMPEGAMHRFAEEISRRSTGQKIVPVSHAYTYPILNWDDVKETDLAKPFYLRAKKEGTTGGDIHENDLLLIAPTARIKSGDTVLWLQTKDDVSVRKYRQFESRIHLIPLTDKLPTAIVTLKRSKRIKLFKITEIKRELGELR